jgi:hypothetical protein
MLKDINVLSQPQTPPVQQPVVQPIRQTDIPSHTIQPRHLKANYYMVKVGLATDRPVDGTSTRFYFSSDTFVMSYYDTDTKTWKSGSAFS